MNLSYAALLRAIICAGVLVGWQGLIFPHGRGLSLASWLMVICLLLLTVGGGPFVARGGGEKMLISYNSAVFDVVPVTVAHQQVSPPPVGRSAM